MTKSELDLFDSIFLAPLCLFVNQLMGTTFSEVRILWACWVSFVLSNNYSFFFKNLISTVCKFCKITWNPDLVHTPKHFKWLWGKKSSLSDLLLGRQTFDSGKVTLNIFLGSKSSCRFANSKCTVLLCYWKIPSNR